MTPHELPRTAGLDVVGTVAWGSPIPSDEEGVYVVSLDRDPDICAGLLAAPIDDHALLIWTQTADGLQMDGAQPTIAALRARLESYWLTDESILYVGKATNLNSRVGSYYRSKIGRRSPHRGGMWLKTLAILESLWIHWCPTPKQEPESIESLLLKAFVAGVSPTSRSVYPAADRNRPLPFANLELRTDGRRYLRMHGLTNQAR